MGSGGSILTVPILHYAFHIEPVMATGYSLFIVGVTSLIGATRSAIGRRNDVRAALIFAPASVISVFLVRKFLLPAIPDTITITSWSMTKNVFIMICFAVLMIAASISMISKQKAPEQDSLPAERVWLVPVLGFLVGAVTGFVGAGGGFLIIPSLVLFARVPMKKAVGTSLVIITINCFVGFFSDLNALVHINWKLLIVFSTLAIIGILVGLGLQKRVPGGRLRKWFGYFVLLMAVYIIFMELR